MKNKLLIGLLMGMIYSCSHNNSPNRDVELTTYKSLQLVIDSITKLSNTKNKVYELFVHKEAEYRGFMLLHIGGEAFYDSEALSIFYLLSNKHKVRIYSGIESYFNLPSKNVTYGRIEGIRENENHLLWGIYMYKDSIIGIHSVDFANPYLLIPAPPFSDREKFYIK